jgi:hypothetical protein
MPAQASKKGAAAAQPLTGDVPASALRYAAARKWQARRARTPQHGARATPSRAHVACKCHHLTHAPAHTHAHLPRGTQQAEDRFLLEPACAWRPGGGSSARGDDGDEAVVPFSVFGVFDGHGGKDAAEECVRGMVPALTAALVRCWGGGRALRWRCGRGALARRTARV